jgi:hypothetical protein
MTKLYRHCKFSIDGETIFEGFMPLDLTKEPFGGYWNGWLCPYVNAEQHDKICKYFMEELDSRTAEPEEYEEINAFVEMEPNEDGLIYIGGGFVWSEVEE